jgi:hypothetical protein
VESEEHLLVILTFFFISGADWEIKWVIRIIVLSCVSESTLVWPRSVSVSRDKKLAEYIFPLVEFP